MTEHSDHDAQGAAGPVADWRAAWKAARGSANGATGSDATPAEETAGDTRPRQRWSPAPEPTWSAAAATAATHGTGRTTTSTLEPQAPGNHRAPAVGGSGGAGHHDTSPTEPSPTEPSPTESSPADDMDESATETTGSLRAAFAQGLARAKALVEGAAREDGRGPSVWDDFSHQPGRIADAVLEVLANSTYVVVHDVADEGDELVEVNEGS